MIMTMLSKSTYRRFIGARKHAVPIADMHSA